MDLGVPRPIGWAPPYGTLHGSPPVLELVILHSIPNQTFMGIWSWSTSICTKPEIPALKKHLRISPMLPCVLARLDCGSQRKVSEFCGGLTTPSLCMLMTHHSAASPQVMALDPTSRIYTEVRWLRPIGSKWHPTFPGQVLRHFPQVLCHFSLPGQSVTRGAFGPRASGFGKGRGWSSKLKVESTWCTWTTSFHSAFFTQSWGLATGDRMVSFPQGQGHWHPQDWGETAVPQSFCRDGLARVAWFSVRPTTVLWNTATTLRVQSTAKVCWCLSQPNLKTP